MSEQPLFRDAQPVAWHFHRNTSRWPFNVLEPEEGNELQLPPKEYPDAPYIALPTPEPCQQSFDRVLRSRFSCRRFLEKPIDQAALARLLHVSIGVLGRAHVGNIEFLERPTSSAGALYPLEAYVLARSVENLEEGVYHYAIVTHGLEQVRLAPLPSSFRSDLFMSQRYVGSASAVIMLTAVVHRSLRKYDDRGYRYLLLEAGHVAQNLNLAATAEGLGNLNLGGFFDSDLSVLLDLDREIEIPLYGVAVGAPAGTDPIALRMPPE